MSRTQLCVQWSMATVVAIGVALGGSPLPLGAVQPAPCGVNFGLVLNPVEGVDGKGSASVVPTDQRMMPADTSPFNHSRSVWSTPSAPRPQWTSGPARPAIKPVRLTPGRPNTAATTRVMRVAPVQARRVSSDFVDAKTGSYFVGFRPGPRTVDYRNVRTGRLLLGVQRGPNGRDLFDPNSGRTIHGVRRADGGFDYFDPRTGRWIFEDSGQPR